MPDSRALGRYIESCSGRFREPLGQTPAAIARKLGAVSYAEAEQFCLDVQRRSVSAMGEKPLKTIVAEQLAVWAERAVVRGPRKGGRRDGETSAADPSDS